MATCKDCLHKCYAEELAEAEQTCNFFIDKSKYVPVWIVNLDGNYMCPECGAKINLEE